jgi:hypothetical protein
MLIQLVKTFIFNYCDKHVNCLHAWRSKPRCYFSDKPWMSCSLWGGPVWVFMHRQRRPWSKLIWKHVMFCWQPSIDFDQSKTTRHKTWASKLEPWHLPLVEICQVLAGSPTHISMPRQPKPPKHIPIKTYNISIVMFWPHARIFHVPHAILIHAPWPIHDTLCLFQLHIVVVYFFIELWRFHRRSPTKDLLRVSITKRAYGGNREVFSFHPH